MDPNACLEEMLRLATRWASWNLEDKSRMAELVEALDGQLSKGGFLPKKWERKPSVIEVATSPLVGYMAEDGKTYCKAHHWAVPDGWVDRIGRATAKAADMSCAICGVKLAK